MSVTTGINDRVISPDDYETLAGYYSNMKAKIESAATYLWDAVYDIGQIPAVNPTYDLIKPFTDTYSTQYNNFQSNISFRSAVVALNAHVLSRAIDNDGDPYPTLMAWMYDNGVKVDAEWADMSTEFGYAITSNATYVNNP